ncbi:MAG TPA: MarR family transcriptional regulator [Gaiellaceae bacterium]
MTSATKTQKLERDHVDRWLETIRERLPMLDPEVEGIVDRIQGLSRRFKRATNETLAEFKLDHAEYKLLGFLNRQDETYRSSPGKLARVMELSSGAMTNRLDRMEEAGLLRRLPDPSDRRGLLVELTPEGKRLYEDAIGVQARKEELIASALSVSEKKQLNALLRRLMIEFERLEGGPPPEDC